MRTIAVGARPSPNIWNAPDVYELENRAVDPDRVIESAIRRHRPWRDAVVLDIGCGTGYHLPRFAQEARAVIGVEPHHDLVALARRRVVRLAGSDPAAAGRIEVRHGAAQRLPLPDASVDVVHARWAYFFGPGCEPGLREVARVLRRGGAAFVIDNDPTRSTFGGWLRRGYPTLDPPAVESFWSRQGWQRERLDMRWRFERRADLEAVVRIEFPSETADQVLAEHAGVEVDYAINLWWRAS